MCRTPSASAIGQKAEKLKIAIFKEVVDVGLVIACIPGRVVVYGSKKTTQWQLTGIMRQSDAYHCKVSLVQHSTLWPLH